MGLSNYLSVLLTFIPKIFVNLVGCMNDESICVIRIGIGSYAS